jgi:hypothetical protein
MRARDRVREIEPERGGGRDLRRQLLKQRTREGVVERAALRRRVGLHLVEATKIELEKSGYK